MQSFDIPKRTIGNSTIKKDDSDDSSEEKNLPAFVEYDMDWANTLDVQVPKKIQDKKDWIKKYLPYLSNKLCSKWIDLIYDTFNISDVAFYEFIKVLSLHLELDSSLERLKYFLENPLEKDFDFSNSAKNNSSSTSGGEDVTPSWNKRESSSFDDKKGDKKIDLKSLEYLIQVLSTKEEKKIPSERFIISEIKKNIQKPASTNSAITPYTDSKDSEESKDSKGSKDDEIDLGFEIESIGSEKSSSYISISIQSSRSSEEDSGESDITDVSSRGNGNDFSTRISNQFKNHNSLELNSSSESNGSSESIKSISLSKYSSEKNDKVQTTPKVPSPKRKISLELKQENVQDENDLKESFKKINVVQTRKKTKATGDLKKIKKTPKNIKNEKISKKEKKQCCHS